MGLRETLDAEDFAFNSEAEEAIATLWNLARQERKLERTIQKLQKLERTSALLCNKVTEYTRGDDLEELEIAADNVMDVLQGKTS